MREKLDIVSAAARIRSELAEKGLRAEQVTDLVRAREILETMGAGSNNTESKGPYVTKWLDPFGTPITERHSFWLFLYKDHMPVAKVATRYDLLGRESLRSFYSRTLRALHPNDRSAPPPDRFPAVTDTITGNVAFCGDLFVTKAARALDPVPSMIALNYMLMNLNWGTPDWTVCFVREADGRRWEWTQRYWTMHKDTTSLAYPPSAPQRHIWMGVLDADGFERIIDRNLHSTAVPDMNDQEHLVPAPPG